MVEFALVLPLLTLVLIGGLDAGLLLDSKLIGTGAVRAGARMAALVGDGTKEPSPATQDQLDARIVGATLAGARGLPFATLQELNIYRPSGSSRGELDRSRDPHDRFVFDSSGRPAADPSQRSLPTAARGSGPPEPALIGVQLVWRYRPPGGIELQLSDYAVMRVVPRPEVPKPGPTPGGRPTLSALSYHTCGIKADRTVVCWGLNDFGQAAPPPGTFTAVSAGVQHSCGLKSDATLACWGSNIYDNRRDPVVVGVTAPPPGTFTAMSAGLGHTCALRVDTTLVCWGFNSHGQATPPSGTFAAVSAGLYYSCGIRTDGGLVCWGSAFWAGSAPTGTFKAVSVVWGGNCALRTEGTVACWGGTVGSPAGPGGTFTAVSTGQYHACGLRPDGTLFCWRLLHFGDQTAVLTPPPGTFTSVASGASHSCGVRTDGTVACWGDPAFGALTPPPAAFPPIP
jgi:alpha-tubulin suppressor-like RCC1 family protein